jgi:DNA repair protein RadC
MKNSDRIPGLRVSLVRDAGVPNPNPARPAVADSPARVHEIVRAFIPQGDEREHLVAVYVNARSEVKGVCVVSIGTLSASLVHPREVFRPAIVAGAAAVIVAHNHPSGDCTPSAEDKDATRRLSRAGELLGVPLLDHLVVTDGGDFFSFKDRGLL